MPPPVEDRRPPITPQLAVRVAVLGGVAFVAFAIIFFRLWFLQVLTGDDYVSQARDNRVRKIKIEAPRGNIIDRNGKTLVKTRAAPVVQILPTQVPEAELEVADQYRKALALVEGRRLAAEQDLRSLERRLAADGRKSTKAEKRRRKSRWRRAPRRPSACASRRSRPGSRSCGRSTAGSAGSSRCGRWRSIAGSSRGSPTSRART